jgi:hypothetical protein
MIGTIPTSFYVLWRVGMRGARVYKIPPHPILLPPGEKGKGTNTIF